MALKFLKARGTAMVTAAFIAATALFGSVPSFAYTDGGNTYEWQEADGKYYWYENGVRQGVFGSTGNVFYDNKERGREIYDAESDGWYWLDAIYDGAKAANKEVFMPYIYSKEESKFTDENWVNAMASFSNKTGENGGEVVDLSAQVKKAIMCHGQKGAGKWVRYDAEGKMIKGWYKVQGSDEALYPSQKGNIYYYDRQTGLMAKGYATIDGVEYYFDESTGKLISGEPPYIADRNGSSDSGSNTTKKNNLTGRANATEGIGEPKELEVDDITPDFTVDLVGGKKFTLSDYDDKTVLLIKWATWCRYCGGELPEIQKLADEYKNDLVVIALNCGEREERVDDYVADFGYTFNVAYDPDKKVCDYYPSNGAVPYTFISRGGKIAIIIRGATGYDNLKYYIDYATRYY